MASITLVINNKGFLSFKTLDHHLKVLGEFLTVDIGYMPDFARALLSCPFQEQLQLTASQITSNEKDILLQSLAKSDQGITIAKSILLSIIETWEKIVIQEKKQFFIKEIVMHDINYTFLSSSEIAQKNTGSSKSQNKSLS